MGSEDVLHLGILRRRNSVQWEKCCKRTQQIPFLAPATSQTVPLAFLHLEFIIQREQVHGPLIADTPCGWGTLDGHRVHKTLGGPLDDRGNRA